MREPMNFCWASQSLIPINRSLINQSERLTRGANRENRGSIWFPFDNDMIMDRWWPIWPRWWSTITILEPFSRRKSHSRKAIPRFSSVIFLYRVSQKFPPTHGPVYPGTDHKRDLWAALYNRSEPSLWWSLPMSGGGSTTLFRRSLRMPLLNGSLSPVIRECRPNPWDIFWT